MAQKTEGPIELDDGTWWCLTCEKDLDGNTCRDCDGTIQVEEIPEA